MSKILEIFGFCSLDSFAESVFKPQSASVISVFAFSLTVISQALGLEPYSMLVMLVLMLTELLLGVLLALRTKTFKLYKLERFALKVFVYLFILFVLHAFARQYELGSVKSYTYDSIHYFMVFWIIAVYLISILKTIHRLTGEKSKELNSLINIFSAKFWSSVNKFKKDEDE